MKVHRHTVREISLTYSEIFIDELLELSGRFTLSADATAWRLGLGWWEHEGPVSLILDDLLRKKDEYKSQITLLPASKNYSDMINSEHERILQDFAHIVLLLRLINDKLQLICECEPQDWLLECFWTVFALNFILLPTIIFSNHHTCDDLLDQSVYTTVFKFWKLTSPLVSLRVCLTAVPASFRWHRTTYWAYYRCPGV